MAMIECSFYKVTNFQIYDRNKFKFGLQYEENVQIQHQRYVEKSRRQPQRFLKKIQLPEAPQIGEIFYLDSDCYVIHARHWFTESQDNPLLICVISVVQVSTVTTEKTEEKTGAMLALEERDAILDSQKNKEERDALFDFNQELKSRNKRLKEANFELKNELDSQKASHTVSKNRLQACEKKIANQYKELSGSKKVHQKTIAELEQESKDRLENYAELKKESKDRLEKFETSQSDLSREIIYNRDVKAIVKELGKELDVAKTDLISAKTKLTNLEDNTAVKALLKLQRLAKTDLDALDVIVMELLNSGFVGCDVEVALTRCRSKREAFKRENSELFRTSESSLDDTVKELLSHFTPGEVNSALADIRLKKNNLDWVKNRRVPDTHLPLLVNADGDESELKSSRTFAYLHLNTEGSAFKYTACILGPKCDFTQQFNSITQYQNYLKADCTNVFDLGVFSKYMNSPKDVAGYLQLS